VILAAALIPFLRVPSASSAPPAKPKVRAVTAFIRLDRANYKTQIQDALKFLHVAKAAFEKAGYDYTGEGKQFAIALESANVVAEALASAKSPGAAEEKLTSTLGAYAISIEKTAMEISQANGWTYGGIDLSPAPLKDISIGRAIENFFGAPVGSSGTLSAAALITRSLKAIPVKHAGYSGLMLPIMEDTVLARSWSEGHLAIDSLLAYSAVCGTGLDTIPLPGDITEDQLARILGDVASLSVKWHKPLSARLQPVTGKHPGDMTEFDDPYLVNARIQPLP
jgi:hypothetical protein